MSTLFISHSSRDADAARELKASLEGQGHRSLFLDLDPEKGIQAGVSWERTLYTKLRACRAVVALCSDNYLASHWCFAEIALARMEGKEIFALQIEPWGEGTRMPSILTGEQYVDLRRDRAKGLKRLWNAFKVKGILPSEHREWGPNDPPYPGLRAFNEGDQDIFFGRDEETLAGVELLNRVRRQGHPRLVMVLGSSGSGKSSVARAGIVPRLRADREQWRVVGPFRPGLAPARELAAALAEAFGRAGDARAPEEIERALAGAAEPRPPAAGGSSAESNGRQVRRRLREALELLGRELGDADRPVLDAIRQLEEYLASAPPPAPVEPPPDAPVAGGPLAALANRLRLAEGPSEASVVLVIDQFEELLGHGAGVSDHPANRFLALLRDAIESDDHPPLVLATMRSDYLDAFQRTRALLGVGFKSLSIGPMAREAMRQVIVEPARLGQLELEPGLTDLLLDDTETSDALPLLAFTLREMWDRYRADRLFEIREYDHLGRLQGAIARVAEETFETALAAGTEETLRDSFLSLARPTEGGAGWARQPASWDELPEGSRPMLMRFLDKRLLVTRPDGTIEVAHEALFRSWGRLRGWLAANSEALLLRGEIRIEAERWQRAETDSEREPYLWRGGRLARALELRDGGVLVLQELERAFIEASEAAERARLDAEAERQRRELRRARIFAAVVGAAFLVTAGLFLYAQEKKRRARDQALIAVASDWLERDPTRAGLVLLELDDPRKAARAVPLLGAALTGRPALLEIRGHEDAVDAAVFHPDGDRIVTASADRTARFWTAEGEPLLDAAGEQLVIEHPAVVSDVAFRPQGDRLATASFDGKVRFFLTDGSAVLDATGEPLVVSHDKVVNRVAWSESGERLVTASDDGTARVWSADGELLTVLEHPPGRPDGPRLEANGALFDARGERVLTGSENGTARIWSASGGSDPIVLVGHGGSVLGLAFDSTGNRVATGSRDGTARLWNTDGTPVTGGGGEPIVLRHPDQVVDVRFVVRPTGEALLSASRDGQVRLWEVGRAGEYAARVLSRGSAVLRLDLRADGERFLTANVDGSARVWGVECCGEPLVLPHKSARNSRFHGDGVVSAATDGVIVTRSLTSAADSEIRLVGHDGRLKSVAFDPAGERIVSGGRDGTARTWRADGAAEVAPDASGQLRPVVLDHEGEVNDAAFDPGGGRIATASDDGKLRVWNSDGSGPAIVGQHAEGARVLSVAWSPRGDRVASAASDGEVAIWSAEGARLASLSHDEAVNAVAWSPDGDRVAAATRDRKAWVWSADGTGEPVLLAGHERSVAAIAWSPDGRRIATGSYDETARVWNADGSGEPLVLGGHPNAVVDVAFDARGELLVTTSLYVDARVWRVTYGLLGAAIRTATDVCLDPDFRERSLGEAPDTAAARYRRCAECRSAFEESADGVEPENAFREYRRCVLAGRWL